MRIRLDMVRLLGLGGIMIRAGLDRQGLPERAERRNGRGALGGAPIGTAGVAERPGLAPWRMAGDTGCRKRVSRNGAFAFQGGAEGVGECEATGGHESAAHKARHRRPCGARRALPCTRAAAQGRVRGDRGAQGKTLQTRQGAAGGIEPVLKLVADRGIGQQLPEMGLLRLPLVDELKRPAELVAQVAEHREVGMGEPVHGTPPATSRGERGAPGEDGVTGWPAEEAGGGITRPPARRVRLKPLRDTLPPSGTEDKDPEKSREERDSLSFVE